MQRQQLRVYAIIQMHLNGQQDKCFGAQLTLKTIQRAPRP